MDISCTCREGWTEDCCSNVAGVSPLLPRVSCVYIVFVLRLSTALGQLPCGPSPVNALRGANTAGGTALSIFRRPFCFCLPPPTHPRRLSAATSCSTACPAHSAHGALCHSPLASPCLAAPFPTPSRPPNTSTAPAKPPLSSNCHRQHLIHHPHESLYSASH